MSVDARLVTAEELLEMPEDDGFRLELVRGELQRITWGGAEHGHLALTVGVSLWEFVRDRALGKVYGANTGFILASNPDTVHAPDAAFVRAERVVRTPKYFPGAPDLAIEVVSPNDLYCEVMTKTFEYLRYGTTAVVIIEPVTRTVHVFRVDQYWQPITDFLEVPDVVPGWKLPLSELFEEQLL